LPATEDRLRAFLFQKGTQMATYDWFFNMLGLRDWCDAGTSKAPMSMADLLNKTGNAEAPPFYDIPFPSLDALNEACGQITQTRDVVKGLEEGFLAVRPALRTILDPITQPLSWMLDGTLYVFTEAPWFVIIAAILVVVWYATRSLSVVLFNLFCLSFFALVDHFEPAMETLAVILVCTVISALFGVPIGIAMSKSNRLQKSIIPILDLLQTLPTFVYLIPLIFLFPIGESRLYGIAITLYAIVPIIRLTDLGIRLVDQDVVEAGNAFGMSPGQKLGKVEMPLALPNIMAGLNQTIMMSLAMVVIASMVTAPGLGVLVLRGIRNLELGVGLMAGICIVLLAVMLDRTSKAALSRIDRAKSKTS
jgi:glycine betaine/proline transport system permease protein